MITEHALLPVVAGREERFRGSAADERWRELLHGSYQPFRVVEHVEHVETVASA